MLVIPVLLSFLQVFGRHRSSAAFTADEPLLPLFRLIEALSHLIGGLGLGHGDVRGCTLRAFLP